MILFNINLIISIVALGLAMIIRITGHKKSKDIFKDLEKVDEMLSEMENSSVTDKKIANSLRFILNESVEGNNMPSLIAILVASFIPIINIIFVILEIKEITSKES